MFRSATPSGFRLPQGVGVILLTVFAMALTDGLIKLSSSGMTLWQIWLLRSVLVLPVLVVLARGRLVVPGQGWIVLRSLALVAQYLCLYAVLPLIDMALAGAAFYTAPFFILGLSALVLGNRVTALHWLAVTVGFAGLFLILRPLGAGFSPLVLMAVAAAMFYAAAAIITRARCEAVPAAVLALWLNIGCLLGGIALGLGRLVLPMPDWAFFILGPWHPMAVADWGLVAVLAVLMIGVGLGLAKAYQSPRPEVIAAFDYCYMVFVVFWGFVLFGESPDGWTLAGTVLIVAGGLGVLLADRRTGPPA